MARKIRALIVDDSTFYRGVIVDLLERTGSVNVVGSAGNGAQALARMEQLQPELVTLDVEMPGMDGLQVLKEIRRKFPETLVVMISSASRSSARVTIEALEEGALDFIEKPGGEDMASNERQLYRQLRRIASIVETKLILGGPVGVQQRSMVRDNCTGATPAAAEIEVVAIGVSTGGPGALPEVLAPLPADFPVPVVVVQHMPAMFVSVLAESLNRRIAMEVEEARTGSLLKPGKVYLAPGGKQAKVVRHAVSGDPVIALTDDPPENFCRPSVDYMFRSLASAYGGAVLAVIMTGMGKDGVTGLGSLKSKGARVLAQDESSSVVFGMAMEACRSGVVDEVLALSELAGAILESVDIGHD